MEAPTVDRLRHVLTTIKKHLGGLGPSQKLLIGSLAVILLMTLFLVSQYAARPTMVALLPAARAEDQQRALAYLASQNVTVKEVNGQVTVPAEMRQTALGLLAASGNAPADTTLMFENLLEKQSWMNSKEVNRSFFTQALQNELGAILSKCKGVSRATVFLDIPEPSGIGQTVAKPKASVRLTSDTGGPVDQRMVDAAARFVAGAVARLELSRVTVIDGVSGARMVTDDSELAASTYRDAAAALERQFRERIYNLLRDIDGVVVEVTADVDVKRVRSQEQRSLEPKQGTVSLLRRETSSSTTEGTGARAAEPGLRSNTGSDINAGSASGGAKSEQNETTTEYENHVGTKVDQIEDPRGNPISLVATVSVPRGYVVGLLEREAPGAGNAGGQPLAPSDADIRARFEQEKVRIEEGVKPHLQARGPQGQTVPGQIVVMMSSGFTSGSGGGGMSRAGVGSGGVGTILSLGGGMVDKAILAVLAAVAVGMMLLMVRKAGRQAVTPSAEELVGVPPTLNTKSDLVGEADETDTPIEGIEVGEDEMKASKLREQVSELIQKSPEVAGRMLNRWVSVEQ
jgi:flagellar biosynthesis/type III secretory pathway M-ring protein FliF/YscJ